MRRLTLCFLCIFSLSGVLAYAGDFNWMADFNIKAEKDITDFKAKLATRFKIGKAEIDLVFSNVDKPADAYMIFRLGEMSSKKPKQVIEQYRAKKSQGWGALAKSLGIKPGSKEFHELKAGNDMYSGYNDGKDNSSSGKNKGKGRGKR